MFQPVWLQCLFYIYWLIAELKPLEFEVMISYAYFLIDKASLE